MKLKKYIYSLTVFFLGTVLLLTGCELVDPTSVQNPDITEQKLFEDATGGATPLITGLQFAFSDALSQTALYTEVVSDNYLNTSAYISTLIDNPRLITPNEMFLADPREIYFRLQTLNALADFGLNTVLPSDPTATNKQIAQTHFYKAMAVIMLCENFQAFPLLENGAAVKAQDAIKTAIEHLNKSYEIYSGEDNGVNVKLALARAYRLANDKANAVTAANDALALSANHVFYAKYDPINLLNSINIFTVIRGQNDMQPLPSLDFLDPKYPNADGSDPIPSLKSEEAYLILAEAALADGNLPGAKSRMINAINLAISRPSTLFTDNDTRRNRPNANDLKVKYDAASPEVSGLIFERGGNTVTVNPVSNTHLRQADIQGLNTQEELFRALYLLRQEIFFGEARRMSDLGIRLPMMARQIDSNTNINYGDYGTSVFVPDYIPQNRELDEFTFDEANKLVTLKQDMNKILAQNMSLVSPFM